MRTQHVPLFTACPALTARKASGDYCTLAIFYKTRMTAELYCLISGLGEASQTIEPGPHCYNTLAEKRRKV
jgi:hypothetical protein